VRSTCCDLGVHAAVVAALVIVGVIGVTRADATDCPHQDDSIETDRPDVSNSSLVVPQGSLQIESGIDGNHTDQGRTLDGPQARIRFGAFRCGELLVDLPNYSQSFAGRGGTSSSPVVISIKRQLFEHATAFSASATVGVGLPNTSAPPAAGGYSPYAQLPWSRALSEEWSLSGMVTVTWATHKEAVVEPTLVLGREFGRRSELFIETISDYARHHRAVHTLDGGGGLRITPKQQVDFHIGMSLSPDSRRRYVGVGYSVRFDRR
jgi:hypothetical protein